MAGFTYNKLNIGDHFTETKTVTETHMLLYYSISGDSNSLHVNDVYARKTKFGNRIVYGFLTLIFGTGILGSITDRTSLGYLGMTDVKMTKPVIIGDTLSTRFEVIAKKDVAKWNGGVVTLKQTVRNQTDEIVLEATHAVAVANTES